LLTGQPYLVRTRDGKEMPLNTWLTDALREHRQHDGNWSPSFPHSVRV